MSRTIKDATVKVYHYDDLESLKAHVLWTKDPSIFKINPHHVILGTNS